MPAEVIVRSVDGVGNDVSIVNNGGSWGVVIARADGTSDYKSAGSKGGCHRIISEMKDGYFFVPEPEPVAVPQRSRLRKAK